jgi:hypothetical protein
MLQCIADEYPLGIYCFAAEDAALQQDAAGGAKRGRLCSITIVAKFFYGEMKWNAKSAGTARPG